MDAAGTDNAECSQAMPCAHIAAALATGRAIVKVGGTIDEHVSLVDRDVQLFADLGAKLTSTSNGILLKIDGASTGFTHRTFFLGFNRSCP